MSPIINLIVQLCLGTALLIGTFLARRQRFVAHGICQTVVVLLNLIPIFLFMAPHFHEGALPGIPAKLGDSYYLAAGAHATFGTIAEFFGIYLILTGWKLLPAASRVERLKPWMRFELAVWWITIGLGVVTFYVWNVAAPVSKAPPVAVTQSAGNTNSNAPAPKTVTVEVTNYEFKPAALTIEAGTTVVWKNQTGRHTVVADDQGFQSETLAPGLEFQRTFAAPGDYKYYCSIHGAAGGAGMSGTIKVTPRGN
jgi:plastocyanin/uncharacterized membrane protein YozB (DUF420 family)